MAEKEKKTLEKKNWISSFQLIGQAKINDKTYKLDEKSTKSNWVYNSLNLGVYCGEVCGTVYTELMGGYGEDRDNVIYVHGKDENGKDEFDNKFTIDWDDRKDETILETIGDFCFLTVGLEKYPDKNSGTEKTFYKKFLSAYDAIEYINQHLEDGMVVNVKGNLKYSMYDGYTQVKKEINSIVLSKVEKESDYKATFSQTMLLTKDSLDKPDKTTGILPITGKVLDYTKMYNGKEVKCFIPYDVSFEYELDLSNKEKCEKIIKKVFEVKKDVTEITFEGVFVESGALVTATEDDIPEDIKELVEIGVYTMEEALTKCTVSGGRARRMVIKKPYIKIVEGQDGSKTPILQKFEKKYTEDDLILDCMLATEDEENEDEGTTTTDLLGDDDSWLDELD